jgi:predicted esterase YcpF (UPF0227 family)
MVGKEIIYLHGLESKQGGPKVDFLATKGFVYAPSIDYENFTYNDFYDLLHYVSSDSIIIGSSMGGYLADIIASHKGCTALLFNPALHSRSLKIDPNIKYDYNYADKIVVLGEEDEVIDPITTKAMLDGTERIEMIEKMGHQTPLNIFIDIYNKYF